MRLREVPDGDTRRQRTASALRRRVSDPLVVQNVLLGIAVPPLLLALLAMPGMIHPERRWWVLACIPSFLAFGLLAVVRGRVGTAFIRVRSIEALLMVPVIGTSSDRLGVVIPCAMTTVLVLVQAAVHLRARDLIGFTGLAMIAQAALLAGHGAHGAELLVNSLSAAVIAGVPALVLFGFRVQLQAGELTARTLARTDALTGLLNRNGLVGGVEVLTRRAELSGAVVGVLMVDLDHFKRVNDDYGHLVGDQVLRRVADALRAAARSGDVVARLGGEEICVVMECTGLQELAAAGERLRAAVEALDGVPPVTVSVGATCAPVAPGEDAEEFVMRLIGRADVPLYEVKAAGRNGVRVLAA